MKEKDKSTKAIFDIRPVDQAGRVDLAKIENIATELNLRKPVVLEVRTVSEPVKKSPVNLTKKEEVLDRENLIESFHEELHKENELELVLAEVGGMVHKGGLKEILRKNISFPRVENMALAEQTFSPIAREVEVRLENFQNITSSDDASANYSNLPNQVPITNASSQKEQRTQRQYLSKLKLTAFSLLLIAFVFFGLFKLKNNLQTEVVQSGNEAVKNLETAKADIEKFDFASAAIRFALAYESFSGASSNLNLLGNSLSSFLGDLPGFGKLKSAQNLSKAGASIAEAGKNLSSAVDNFYRSNLVSEKNSLLDFISPLKNSLVSAQERVKLAGQLLAQVDDDVIPEEKKESFLDFKSKLPDLQNFMDGALSYAGFLSEAVGDSGPKKYLVLFQNNTELRPTGGFIGSYALVDFSRGFLRELKVEDVYYTDGQAKKNIIPPKELQHITPSWGMRDANWFVNFPDSARKIMELYTENDGGPLVDGVLSITPDVILNILKVTGPIELLEYGRTIDSENFLAEIQEEVEYGENREKPKQILVDFMPKFMEILGRQDKEKWLEIFKILASSAEQKHILAYFKNSSLEKVAVDNGFGGEVKETDGDFLMVVHSNVKGSKTDAVIDNSYEVDSWVSEDGFVEHQLKIKRKHNGGKTKLGFYNRTNYDFVRVLVPKGSVLSEVKGDYKANFKPLINYGESASFVTDADLENYESDSKESGKSIFSFWLKLEPGQSQEVVLEYKTPVSVSAGNYTLLVQKQPGTDDKFDFVFQLPEEMEVTYKYPELVIQDGVVYFGTYLLKDLVIGLKLQ
ncbi:MAG: DUF4012 domain-containing protein [Candidatus Yanofskybacteria bacterium]|nr:DUF4012 domain-containing protein [Candidatus Yanofskybacteria bacterium]